MLNRPNMLPEILDFFYKYLRFFSYYLKKCFNYHEKHLRFKQSVLFIVVYTVLFQHWHALTTQVRNRSIGSPRSPLIQNQDFT